jgi:hypothetical protein
MNCIEALQEHLRRCEPCIKNAFIMDFEKIPEVERIIHYYYDKDKHFILYCKKCDTYKILGES